MILERALVLLFASISAVAGFSPCGHSTFPLSLASSYASRAAFSPSVRVASTIFSEAESSETVVSEVPAFETAIYVGNISFGKFGGTIEYCGGDIVLSSLPVKSFIVRLYKIKEPLRVTSELPLLHTDLFLRSQSRWIEQR